MSSRIGSRRAFRSVATLGEALAIDPGAGGLLASAISGRQPSPQAFGFMYDVPPPLAFDPEATEDGIAVLELSGPIEHHDSGWCHSYEALAWQAERAMQAGDVRAVVLKIDSPGGVAAGMGEAHKALRILSAKYGKPLYGFADEMACSAAYHLISACREVWTTPAGHIGSVGVILCTVDESKRLEAQGIAVRYLVTGRRKADLHPGTVVTDEVADVAQAKVDKLGRQFFRRVARSRGQAPGGSALSTPEAVRDLQAAVFVGDDAVGAGLADGVASWARFMRLVKGAVMSGAAA